MSTGGFGGSGDVLVSSIILLMGGAAVKHVYIDSRHSDPSALNSIKLKVMERSSCVCCRSVKGVTGNTYFYKIY